METVITWVVFTLVLAAAGAWYWFRGRHRTSSRPPIDLAAGAEARRRDRDAAEGVHRDAEILRARNTLDQGGGW